MNKEKKNLYTRMWLLLKKDLLDSVKERELEFRKMNIFKKLKNFDMFVGFTSTLELVKYMNKAEGITEKEEEFFKNKWFLIKADMEGKLNRFYLTFEEWSRRSWFHQKEVVARSAEVVKIYQAIERIEKESLI
jgi:hypothetical protein